MIPAHPEPNIRLVKNCYRLFLCNRLEKVTAAPGSILSKPNSAADQWSVTLIFCRANLENITYFVKGKTQYFVFFL